MNNWGDGSVIYSHVNWMGAHIVSPLDNKENLTNGLIDQVRQLAFPSI